MSFYKSPLRQHCLLPNQQLIPAEELSPNFLINVKLGDCNIKQRPHVFNNRSQLRPGQNRITKSYPASELIYSGFVLYLPQPHTCITCFRINSNRVTGSSSINFPSSNYCNAMRILRSGTYIFGLTNDRYFENLTIFDLTVT